MVVRMQASIAFPQMIFDEAKSFQNYYNCECPGVKETLVALMGKE